MDLYRIHRDPFGGEATHLARLSCMSATGRTVAQYITQSRMEETRQLLCKTDLPVAEIARSVGYRKPGAFAHAYRNVTGQLPLETHRAF